MTLQVEDLACRRDGRTIFAGLCFTLDQGEVRALRGPNGVGKSSLLRTLAGLVPAAAGKIRLGSATSRETDLWAERVAYAGHLDAVKPQLTVEENLRFWAALFGGDDVGAALAAFRLEPIAQRLAGTCSAGQKRRLGLARLLLAPRCLWLLDEPTVALDAEAVAGFAQVVAAHAASGGLALIATHTDLPLAAAGPPLVLGHGHPSDARALADPFLEGSFA